MIRFKLYQILVVQKCTWNSYLFYKWNFCLIQCICFTPAQIYAVDYGWQSGSQPRRSSGDLPSQFWSFKKAKIPHFYIPTTYFLSRALDGAYINKGCPPSQPLSLTNQSRGMILPSQRTFTFGVLMGTELYWLIH